MNTRDMDYVFIDELDHEQLREVVKKLLHHLNLSVYLESTPDYTCYHIKGAENE